MYLNTACLSVHGVHIKVRVGGERGGLPWKQNFVMNCPLCLHASRELVAPLMTLGSQKERVEMNTANPKISALLTGMKYHYPVSSTLATIPLLPLRCALTRNNSG